MGSLLHNETRSIPRPMANTNDDVEVERAQNVQIGLALKLLAVLTITQAQATKDLGCHLT